MLDSPYEGNNLYFKVWQFLSLESKTQHGPARDLLEDFAAGFKGEGWGLVVLQYHQGKLSESEFIEQAQKRGEKCEAYFYIGYHHLLKGDKEKARAYFQKSKETNAFGYYEHLGARARLKQLGAT